MRSTHRPAPALLVLGQMLAAAVLLASGTGCVRFDAAEPLRIGIGDEADDDDERTMHNPHLIPGSASPFAPDDD